MKYGISPLNTTKGTTTSSLLLSPPYIGKKKSMKELALSFNSESLSPNTSLSQLGALSWSHSASGGKFRAAFTGRLRGLVPTKEPKGNWNPFLGYIGPESSRGGVSQTDTTYTRLEQFGCTEEPRGQCFKLEKTAELESQESVQRALLYLKLREDGCSKSQSLVFTRKRKCMFDSTQRKDGPSCHRTIQLGDNRALGPNWSGWQLHSPRLLVHRKFQSADINQDHREYEVLTREFERLNNRTQLQSEGIDFEEIDQTRGRYFATLTREWRKREAAHHRSAKANHSDITVTIPEESTPMPELLPPKLTVEEAPAYHRKSVITANVTVPEVKICPPKLRTSRKPTSKAMATFLEPTRICRFGKGSLVFRSLLPYKSTQKRLTLDKIVPKPIAVESRGKTLVYAIGMKTNAKTMRGPDKA